MGDDFMKSALDRAMERADRIQVSDEKLKEMKYRSEGERIVAEFLRNPEFDVEAAISGYEGEAREYVSKTVESIVLQNIVLPKMESQVVRNEKAFDALYALKRDKEGIRRARDQFNNLSNYYTQAVRQNFEQLKADVELALKQAIQQQTGMSSAQKFDVEQTPEFQENWRQLSAKLDTEYGNALAQLKQQIAQME